KRAAAPPRQFRDQHHIDLPRLREGHHLLALDTIGLCAGASLLENPDNVVSGPRRKGGEVALLARARLIGRGNPAIDRRPLSQLISSGLTLRKPLVWLRSASYQTDKSLIGTGRRRGDDHAGRTRWR